MLYPTTEWDDQHPTCGSCGCGPCVCVDDPNGPIAANVEPDGKTLTDYASGKTVIGRYQVSKKWRRPSEAMGWYEWTSYTATINGRRYYGKHCSDNATIVILRPYANQ